MQSHNNTFETYLSQIRRLMNHEHRNKTSNVFFCFIEYFSTLNVEDCSQGVSWPHVNSHYLKHSRVSHIFVLKFPDLEQTRNKMILLHSVFQYLIIGPKTLKLDSLS